MINKKDIIIFSSIDWDFIWQGHQEIASTLARIGNRVLFVENTGVRSPNLRDLPRLKKRIINWLKGTRGIRKENDNLFIYSPIILPFPYLRLAKIINRWIFLSILKKWQNLMKFDRPVVWSFLPTALTIDTIEHLNYELLIYYCIDNFAQSSHSARKIIRSEDELIKCADLIFVTSHALYDRCHELNNNVHLFPFVVNLDDFKLESSGAGAPADLPSGKPIVGYIGGIHRWLDRNLVRLTALANPDINFVFIGPVQVNIDALKEVSNIHFLGPKPHNVLSTYLAKFDVATIPYLLTEYTRNVYPTKLNEYFSMSKSVISTPIPEIKYFNEEHDNIIFIAKDEKEFSFYIRKSIKEDTEELRLKRREIASNNTWAKHLQDMSSIIEKEIAEKELAGEVSWQDKISNFYQLAHKKALRTLAIFLVGFIALFHSPLVWQLASPLLVEHKPQKADAIVVFAGGVGESGRAGQGYEERVERAVELYHAGFARKIIFSSGYAWKFEEPDLMKLLAVSMGVPEEVIILESEATSNYENALNVFSIMQKQSIDSILLVSSPYNMRRSLLIFRKISPKVKVYASPIRESIFYSHANGANIEQIKAILHEYTGIMYYLIKGYI